MEEVPEDRCGAYAQPLNSTPTVIVILQTTDTEKIKQYKIVTTRNRQQAVQK